jgi:hypothetical protein
MRWFKHFSDNYRGRSIDKFHDELGHTGIACYYLLLEICTEKLEATKEKTEPIFNFPLRFVQRNLRVSSTKLEVFLNIGQGLGLFSYKKTQKELQIEMPILLDLLHYDVVKSRSRRDSVKSQSSLDKERDKEREEDKDNTYCTEQKNQLPTKYESKKEKFKIKAVEEFNDLLSKETKENLFRLFPDQEYISRELIKMTSWLLANEKKNFKTKKGWSMFVMNWLDRGWTKHQNGIATNKVDALDQWIKE